MIMIGVNDIIDEDLNDDAAADDDDGDDDFHDDNDNCVVCINKFHLNSSFFFVELLIAQIITSPF